MSRHFRLFLGLAAALIVLIADAVGGQDRKQGTLTIPQRPISEVLRPDGTLRLEPGLQGSFDTKGFRMVVSQGREPRFMPSAAGLPGQDPSITADGDENWDPQFGDFFTNGPTYAIAVANYTQVFIGGDFTQVGGRQNLPVQNIAEWENEDWTQNAVNGPVNAIAVSGTDIYVGGTFTQTDDWTAVNNIAKFNITTRSWSALSTGLNDTVNVIAVSGTDVYVGGYFTQAGGLPANRIAKWNGTTWSALDTGVSGSVWGIGVSGTDVYVGGAFTQAGAISTTGIARWNGASWSALGGGVNNTVVAIAFSGTDIYVGGAFTQAGGNPANCIAKWDGASWSALGSGVSSSVYAIAVSGTDIYAGGTFTQAGGDPANRIAKWDGSHWAALGSGTDNTIWEIEPIGTDFYVGGTFHSAGGGPACHVAIWNGTAWAHRGSGLNDSVFALATGGEDVYVGGWFSQAGGLPFSCIAKWNGGSWSALGTGTDYDVFAIAVSGTDVYAGGLFTQAGGVPANHVAKWSGESWTALSSGVNGPVNAVAVSGTDVFVGGSFTQAGGVPANSIAKWNGTSWSALGSGVNGYVNAIAVSGTDVYVGGSLTQAGGAPANCVAKWNGTNWSALGTGVNDYVYAIAVSGTNVYVGGYFTQAGGVPANRIARWDGTTWSALGSGLNNTVDAISVNGTDVYAGGWFTLAGGVPANYIAKWSGTTWSALGSGTDPDVRSIAVTGTSLYVGGQFSKAGGRPSYHFGRWMLPLSVTSPNGGEIWEPGTLHDITWAGIAGPVRIEYSTDDGSNWLTIAASTDNDGIYSWTVPDTPSASCRVRVSESADGDPVDTSDGTFMIAGFRVISPNGGENWTDGSPQLITWTTAGGFPMARIELSTDNGSSWLAIAPETANTGSYPWTVAGQASSLSLIRVGDPTDGYPADISDAVFSIVAPQGELQVTILPGEAITAGGQWNVDAGEWQNSGATVLGLSAGEHTVGYRSVIGWTAPPAETVSIANGQLTQLTRTYSRAIPAIERTSLVAIYQSTNGDGWTQNAGWKTPPLHTDGFALPGTEAAWYGLYVIPGDEQRVGAIDLSGNNLQGSIPPALRTLPLLQTLDLASNGLTGMIPPEIGDLGNLASLNLYGNRLSGAIPAELADLSSLQFLNLGNNQFTGPIPASLGGLVNLQTLSLEMNQLNGSIPTALGSLANLQSLNLSWNQLSGSIPVELGGLSALRSLDLSINRLVGTIPDQFVALSNLRGLSLSSNQLSGPIPPLVGSLTNLESLSLLGNYFYDSIPPELANLTNLRGLSLSSNYLSGTIPPELGGLTSLQSLNLSVNQLSGPIPPQLGNLLELTQLNLTGNRLSGPIPVELGGLTKLMILTMNSNQLSGPIPSWLGGLSEMYMLWLQSNRLSGPVPEELSGLTELHDLRLGSNMLSGEIPAAISGLVGLQAGLVDFGYNGLFATDAGLVAFLNLKDPDWASTQTVQPTGVTTAPVGGTTAIASWTPILYQGDPGGYIVSVGTTVGGPYTVAGQTATKSDASLTVTGLTPGTPYYFVVRTRTDAHALNQNILESPDGPEVSAATYAQLTVQGTVRQGGVALPNVVMSGLPGNPISDAQGIYQVSVDAGWSGTVIPTFSGHVFSPASRSYMGLVLDQWDQNFDAEIIEPTITVTAPNGGDIWHLGTIRPITWTQVGLAGTLTVDLYKGGVYLKTLGTPDAVSGSLSWAIPADDTPGTDYRIFIWQGSISDESDADFVLTSAPGKKKLDFNNDGQEDILWRFYGEGAYQGLNVAWLMSQTEIPSPAPLDSNQAGARGRSLLSGAPASVVYHAPRGREAPPSIAKAVGSRTVLSGEKMPVLHAKNIMWDPVDIERGHSKPAGGALG